MAFDNVNNWLNKAKGGIEIEHILSLDGDDTDIINYFRLFEGFGSTILVNQNFNCVQATNRGAEVATGDILIYFSDDFDCPKYWDLQLLHIYMRQDIGKPMLIWVNDTITGEKEICTIPIMSKTLYDKLGWMWYPEYESMYCDEDLYQVCNSMGAIVNAKHLTFPHLHWINGKSKMDKTYEQHDNKERHERGKAIFEKRKSEGFGKIQ
jgi:glycosyltransferase involved in cell wall biosynthesis